MITMRYPREPRVASPQALLYSQYTYSNAFCPAPLAMANAEFNVSGGFLNTIPVDFWKFTSDGDTIRFDADPVDTFGNKECFHSKVDAEIVLKRNLLASNYLKMTTVPPNVSSFGVPSLPNGWASSSTAATYSGMVSDGNPDEMVGCNMPTNISSRPVHSPLGCLTGLDVENYTYQSKHKSDGKCNSIHVWGCYASRFLPVNNGPVFSFAFSIVIGGSTGEWAGNTTLYPNNWALTVGLPTTYGQQQKMWLWQSRYSQWGVGQVDWQSAYSAVGPTCFSGFPGYVTKFSSATAVLRWVENSVFSHAKLLIAQAYASFTRSPYGPYWSEGFSVDAPSYDEVEAARVEAKHILGVPVAATDAYVGSGITPHSDLCELGNQCISGCSEFSSNLLAYASDLKKTGDTIKALLELARSPTNPKSWASAWLSARYGDKLAWQDTKELMLAIKSELSQVEDNLRGALLSRGMLSSVIQDIPLSLYSSAQRLNFQKAYFWPRDWNKAMKWIRNAMEWDYWPTLENTWDMIPLSFVVDWFVHIGDWLGGIDRLVYMQYIDLASIIVSEKDIFSCNLAWLNSHLTLTRCVRAQCVVYKRRHTSSLDWQPFGGLFGLPSSINVVDAGALALQLA